MLAVIVICAGLVSTCDETNAERVMMSQQEFPTGAACMLASEIFVAAKGMAKPDETIAIYCGPAEAIRKRFSFEAI